eukprot:gb/GECG01007688.1/.p1 GENE.gb/GECG01007688.1/~~gb/GECG01007688.1/.p1  ORF type:complete len:613 (+),score=84.19 gb/GECG01007688.1/:1-1839(+)
MGVCLSKKPQRDNTHSNPLAGGNVKGSSPLYQDTTPPYYQSYDATPDVGLLKKELLYACSEGNVKSAKDVLHTRLFDVNTPLNAKGTTALHAAAAAGQMQITILVFRKWGADPDARTRNGDTPLLLATRFNHTAIAELMITHGADFTKANIHGETPLHVATRKRNAKLVKLILDTGGSDVINLPNKRGETPVALGKRSKDKPIVEMFRQFQNVSCTTQVKNRKKKTKSSKERNSSSMQAASVGDIATLKQLLRGKSKEQVEHLKSSKQSTLLHIASAAGHLNIVSFLLHDIGVAPNLQTRGGETALHMAVKFDHGDIVKELVANSASLTLQDKKDGNTPLHYAVLKGDINLVSPLATEEAVLVKNKNGFSALDLATQRKLVPIRSKLRSVKGCPEEQDNKSGEKESVETNETNAVSPKHIPSVLSAASSGQLEQLQTLLSSDKNPHVNCIKNAKGTTPFHAAVCGGHSQVCIYLLEKCGADPNLQTRKGETALHLACRFRRQQLFEILNAFGADPLVKDSRGQTALHTAAKEGSAEDIRALCTLFDPPVDSTDMNGETALHAAVKAGNAETARYLMKSCGASTQISSVSGQTPVSLAEVSKHRPIRVLFRFA